MQYAAGRSYIPAGFLVSFPLKQGGDRAVPRNPKQKASIRMVLKREKKQTFDMYNTYTCECGAGHRFPDYVFPYWEVAVRRSCACGRTHRIGLGESGPSAVLSSPGRV